MSKWTTERRKKLKSGEIHGGFAGAPCDKPMSYPIAGPQDVRDAWKLAGHSCHPDKVRDNIKRIAKKYGWESALPDTAKNKDMTRVKALGEDRFGSYAIMWGNKRQRDITGEYFTPQTKGLLEIYNAIGKLPVVYHHTMDNKVGGEVVGVIDTVRTDDIGVWVEGELRKASRYRDAIKYMMKNQGLYFSSGALPMSKKVGRNGEIKQWVWAELSLTPEPAEPRMTVAPVKLLKSYSEIGIDAATIKSIVPQLDTEKVTGMASNDRQVIDQPIKTHRDTGDVTMPTFDELYRQRIQEAEELESIGDIDAAVALRNQAEGIKEAANYAITDTATKSAPGDFTNLMRPPIDIYAQDDNGEDDDPDAAAIKTFYYNRIGSDEDAAVKSVYKGIFGPSYIDAIVNQERAFAKFLRRGERALNRQEEAILNVQIFPSDHIKSLMKAGLDTSAIKATMVEAQGTLGGFAVPPTVQRDILSRMPGYTVVRSGGATVITLQNGNSIEIPEYTGGDDVYTGKLRGAWGAEASTPPKREMSWGFKQLMANIYTYRMRLSRTLVEDAQNIVQFISGKITEVLALDEDREFLIGDGIGKPLGILPDGTNSNGFKEINSGSASAVTDDGVRKMKRALARQYRDTARWIANSDTYGEIERLKDTTGRTLYFDLTATETLLGKPIEETEFMPDIAANAYPLVFANLKAYWIVEKYGLTIERYQDSNTGINSVEYHVRRRVGGAPVEPWYFAVMKIAS